MSSSLEIFTAAKVLNEIISAGISSGIVAKPSLATRNGKTVLLGVTKTKRLLLMIPNDLNQIVDEDEHLTPTLTIRAIEQVDSNENLQRFLTLESSVGFDVTLFGAICDQAILELPSVEDAGTLLRTIVNHWRKLLESNSVDLISKNKAIGLFGELVFLQAMHSQCGDDALTSWVGPEGARYDFQLKSAAVEVKTTTRTDSLLAEVHGIDQFEKIDGKSIWLAVAQIEWDPHGVSLEQMIKDSRELFSDKSKFDEKLALFGINELSAIESSFIFSIKQTYLNVVDERFPFLNKKAISELIDIDRLRNISYVVGLDGLCTPVDGYELDRLIGTVCQK